MSKEILLSISILMSGRKETRKCLDSIKPILDTVSSELILVDTGCDNETREILREYTDIIIPFEWCNDFSKARNEGLKRAIGKWFMYMDDDEWFDDVSEIIEFFNHGEYKKYNSASYIVRNYRTFDETMYSDISVGRMFKREENSRFISKIHESINNLKGPTKVFEAYVKHFGYVFTSKKDFYEHSKRNLGLLKEELKNNPEDIRLFLQMLQEYNRIDEIDSIIEQTNYYIEHIVRKNEEKIHDLRFNEYYIYAYMIRAYEKIYDYKDVLNTINTLYKQNINNEVMKAFCYKSEVIANYELKEYSRAFNAFKKYIELFNEIGNDKEIKYEKGGFILDETFREEMYYKILCYGMMISMQLDIEKVVKKYFFEVKWDKVETQILKSFFDVFIKYVLDREYKDDYVKYINVLVQNNFFENMFMEYLKKLEKQVEDNNKEFEEDNNRIDNCVYLDNKKRFNNAIKVFSEVKSNYWFITYLKILNYKKDRDREKCMNNFKELFMHVVDIFNIDKKVWEIAEEISINFDSLINYLSFDEWKDGIKSWLDDTNLKDILYKEKLINGHSNVDNYKYRYFNMKVLEGKLRYMDRCNTSFEKVEKMIFDYAHCSYDYYSKVYNENTIMDHMEVLPKECILAIKLSEIENKRKDKDNQAIIDMIKGCINIYDPFNNILKIYLQKFGEFIKQDDDNIDDVSQELAQITSSLKLKVREFIENGNIVEARVVLNQIIQCVPEDKEAKEILNMISE